jgi:hypothetical protein
MNLRLQFSSFPPPRSHQFSLESLYPPFLHFIQPHHRKTCPEKFHYTQKVKGPTDEAGFGELF